MNYVKALVAVFALALFTTNPASAGPIEDTAKSVVKIFSKERPYCSGVVVAPNTIVTANHCITEGMSIQIAVYDEKAQETYKEVFALDGGVLNNRPENKNNDVAVFKTRHDLKLPSVEICKNTPKFNEPVYALGFPAGRELTVTSGVWLAKTKLEPLGLNGIFYRTTVPVFGGSSGGGLFQYTDKGACLTGLATAYFNGNSFTSYFSTEKSLKELTD